MWRSVCSIPGFSVLTLGKIAFLLIVNETVRHYSCWFSEHDWISKDAEFWSWTASQKCLLSLTTYYPLSSKVNAKWGKHASQEKNLTRFQPYWEKKTILSRQESSYRWKIRPKSQGKKRLPSRCIWYATNRHLSLSGSAWLPGTFSVVPNLTNRPKVVAVNSTRSWRINSHFFLFELYDKKN